MKSAIRENGDKALDRYKKHLARRRKRLTQPSLIEGLSRIFDIAGTIQDKPTLNIMHFSGHGFYNESSGFEDDAKELASDWYTVVNDLEKSTKELVDREDLSK